MFDHERLDVYKVELEFVGWVSDLFEVLSKSPTARTREVCDHLDRASLSVLFNTAEGNGKRQKQIRAKFLMTPGDLRQSAPQRSMRWLRSASSSKSRFRRAKS
jgi:23S rRNA-intervening sequence protein